MSTNSKRQRAVARAATINIRSEAIRVRHWIARQPATSPLSVEALKSALGLPNIPEVTLVSMAISDPTL